MDTFRRDLKTYKPDDIVVATRQKNAINETIGNPKVKLQVAEENPTEQEFLLRYKQTSLQLSRMARNGQPLISTVQEMSSIYGE